MGQENVSDAILVQKILNHRAQLVKHELCSARPRHSTSQQHVLWPAMKYIYKQYQKINVSQQPPIISIYGWKIKKENVRAAYCLTDGGEFHIWRKNDNI